MLRLAFALAVAWLGGGVAWAKPPISAFTPVAEIHDMTLSPDGKRIAWVQTTADGDGVAERNLETGEVTALIRADGREIMGLRYLTDKHLHFLAYRPEYNAREKDAYRIATAHIFDLSRKTAYRFDGYGEVLAVTRDEKRVFMSTGSRVLEIMLDTGNVWSDDLGRQAERDLVIDPEGKLRAAQEINRETGINRIFAADGTDRRLLFQEGPQPAQVHPLALMPDAKSITVEDRRDGARAIRAIGLEDGVMSEPMFGLVNAEVQSAILDRRGTFIGATITGLYPRHEFLDAGLTGDARSLSAAYPGQAVRIVNWSDDRSRILLHVEGGVEPGRYALFDREARKLISLMPTRPAIPAGDMGEVVTIEYAARDGQKIGAVLTWPARVAADQRRNLPLVVMPNQTLDLYEAVNFDWIAQYLANEGYAVFQPNYRGSGGRGASFRAAGHDQFGRDMQHDVTDGVHALAEMGWIDADRVCIVGQGWGGYVALMGGAITPDRYRCVAAIGPVTDIPDFIKRLSEGDQRYNDYVGRWLKMLGDPDANWTNQNRYSPVNLARQFSAPVLLFHSDFDLFSPDRQSRKMQQALEAADKPVRLVRFERENEYLIRPETRTRVLADLGAFIAENMQPRQTPPAAPAPP